MRFRGAEPVSACETQAATWTGETDTTFLETALDVAVKCSSNLRARLRLRRREIRAPQVRWLC
jgi:hypothetical protein